MSETIEPTTEAGVALAVIAPASLPTLMAADQADILGKLRSELAGYKPDASTEAGRKEIGQKTRRIGVAKMDFKRLKDGLLEDAKKQVASVNAEYKIIETNCDALRDAIDGVLETYKQIERDRVAGHEAALRDIADIAFYEAGSARSDEIEARISQATYRHSDRNWQDFAQRATETRATAIKYLTNDLEATRNREAEAAELARLRAEQAERDRLAAIEAQRQREEQIARDAAEAARVAAEAEADRKAQEAQRRAQEERDAAAERERQAAEALAAAQRQAEQEREVAQQVAARAEAARVKGHQDALETMRRLAEPLTPPDAVAVIDAKIARLVDVYDREWEEFGSEAKELLEAGKATLAAARVVSIRVAEEAEAKRQAAEIERQERQQAAAVEAERRRVEEARRAADAETAKRAENVAHRRKINSEALADIMKVMPEIHSGNLAEAETIAKAIIAAMAKSQIRHVSISY